MLIDTTTSKIQVKPTFRLVRPEAGTMVLFPSYFYHCTPPFEIPGPRISIAFDVMPDPAEDSN